MSSSATEIRVAFVRQVSVSDEALTVELDDGRTLTVPLGWYPRLWHGSVAERSHWRLIGNGRGIHWPELDEDISIEGLLQGRPSGESQDSLKRWLAGRLAPGADGPDTVP